MGERGLSGLTDSHVHLDLLPDAPGAIQEALRSGVQIVLGVSMGQASMEKSLQLAARFPDSVFAAVGLHPWQIGVEDVSNALEKVEALLDSAVAVGEIGLDYSIKVRKPLQKEVLCRQLDLALRKDLPVVLHCRYSHRSTLEIVREKGIHRAVFHWYSGPLDVLENLLLEGYFISATPALRTSAKHQEAIRVAPLARILLETDSPVSYEGKEAAPSDVAGVCREVARVKGLKAEEVARETTLNLCSFLGLNR